MNKSWRFTAILAGLLVAVGAVYFLSSPPATTRTPDLKPTRVLEITAEQVTKIEVDRKGTLLTFERSTDSVGEHWRIAGPNSHAADGTLVQQMLFGLDQFVVAWALDPGKPESDPQVTGVADPRIVVTFTSAGRRDVLRFGKSSATDTTIVFYQHEGDPKTYKALVDTFEAFNKPLFQYRAKILVRYAPHRVNRVELEYKYERRSPGKPPVAEYEKSVLERFEEGLERGWYLTSPHRERLDDHKVAGLVTALSSMPAGEYQPEGNAQDQGFDEPQAKVSLFCAGDDKPVQVQFGAPSRNGKQRWVRVPGAGEVALYDGFRYDELPLRRNSLRNGVIFPFSLERVRKLEVEAKDLGKIVLERRETKKEGESVAAVKWEVSEPQDLRVESERVEAFVGAVVVQMITDFYGNQDFKIVGLDPAPVQVVVTTKEGKRHVCGFNADETQGYLRKEGVNEIFVVRSDFVRMLRRLELNFINLEMFNIPRADLRAFTFEARASEELQPVYYSMQFEEKQKRWRFSDPGHQGVEADPDKVNEIMTILNYIKAEGLISRDPKIIEKHRLVERVAPATLKIVHDKGTAEMYVSDDLSGKAGAPMYYARFADNKTVFQIRSRDVAILKQVPILKKEPKEEKKDKEK
ncbi:MAG: DUF4340 domain-containing protein [Planctomycetes bacterium]|nr:DUF4340 domain-containing protein [Planctomycetota bacterium]